MKWYIWIIVFLVIVVVGVFLLMPKEYNDKYMKEAVKFAQTHNSCETAKDCVYNYGSAHSCTTYVINKEYEQKARELFEKADEYYEENNPYYSSTAILDCFPSFTDITCIDNICGRKRFKEPYFEPCENLEKTEQDVCVKTVLKDPHLCDNYFDYNSSLWLRTCIQMVESVDAALCEKISKGGVISIRYNVDDLTSLCYTKLAEGSSDFD